MTRLGQQNSGAERLGVHALLLGLLGAIVVGCLGKPPPKRGNSDDDEDGSGGSASDPDVEEGSCDAWKVAYCKAIKACSAFETEKECQTRIGYITCLKDAPLATCETKIKAAVDKERCQDLPTVCDPVDIADRSEPRRACQDLHQALCERSFFCGFETSIEACVDGFELTQPCTEFTAVLPTFDSCLLAVEAQSCQDSTPESCQGVLIR